MDYLSAAYRVLESARQPLHYKEIASRALAEGLVTSSGQTPAASMGSRLYVDIKKENSRFERVGRGIFGIRQKAKSDDIAKRVTVINDATRRALKKRLHTMPADRFEALVGELLVAIGFDDSTVQVTSYSSDKGIDVRGVLNAGDITEVNAAVQVKRWKKNIQATTVRELRGSLTTHEQGIIITTSDFSKGARTEANAIGKTPISLVNGDRLISLLTRHSVGVNREQHTVYSLDEEWWTEITEETIETTEEVETEAGILFPQLDYPVTVRALNNPNLMAELLNAEGHVRFNGRRYTSPSTAGKDASGWKSCNGWRYWQYQHPDSKVWRLINDLRQ